VFEDGDNMVVAINNVVKAEFDFRKDGYVQCQIYEDSGRMHDFLVKKVEMYGDFAIFIRGDKQIIRMKKPILKPVGFSVYVFHNDRLRIE